MPEIHFVETRVEEQKKVLCRWVESFYDQGLGVQVLVEDTLAAQHLDKLLWSFSQASFIPHRIMGEEEDALREPVVITMEEKHVSGFQVLVCDRPASTDFLAAFPKAVHFVVIDDPQGLERSRKLWQQVKEHGWSLRHTPLEPGKRR